MPISARGRTTVALAIAIPCFLSACGGGSPSKTAASSSPAVLVTTTSSATTTITTDEGTTSTTEAPTTTAPPATLPPATEPAPTALTTTLPPETTAPPAPMSAAISISGFAFHPPSVTVARGGTVTTTNNDSAMHTWTADDGSWSSGTLVAGAAFSHTFTAPGTYAFHCNFHSNMHGSVTVS